MSCGPVETVPQKDTRKSTHHGQNEGCGGHGDHKDAPENCTLHTGRVESHTQTGGTMGGTGGHSVKGRGMGGGEEGMRRRYAKRKWRGGGEGGGWRGPHLAYFSLH